LGQNYPNPFNPVTKITYDVGFVDGPEQHVNLSIYNLLGQHVQTLVDGQQTIGRHTVPWYGRDKTGMNVASGVYFMHMTTSVGKIQTKKVMLLR
jgi:flagellar hook assembly protein FlgD